MWKIVNKQTGKQYRPNSRGSLGHDYRSEYAARQAHESMPARYRAVYRVEKC